MESNKATKLQIASFVLQCISVVSILCAVVALILSKKAMVDQHEWNRRHYTVEVLKSFNSDVEPFKDHVLKAFPGIYQSKNVRSLTPKEADDLYRVDAATDAKKFEERTSVIKLLNYMEFLCTAYQDNVVDQETIYTLYHGLFLRAYEYFRPLIVIAQNELGGQQFQPIVDVCEHWKQLKQQNRFTPKVRTGEFAMFDALRLQVALSRYVWSLLLIGCFAGLLVWISRKWVMSTRSEEGAQGV